MTPPTDPTPLVGIVIPTYNRSEMLAQTLQSALEQTYEHLDILISDDASPDDTADVVAEVAAGDPRVRYVRQEQNLGNLGNSMYLLRSGRGEYVKMLLDDDLIMPTHVETLVRPMIEDPSVALSFSKRMVIDEHGTQRVDPPGVHALTDQPAIMPGVDLATLCLRTQVNWVGEQSTVMYPRRRITSATVCGFGGARISHVLTDLAMWMNLAASGNVFYTPEVLSAFRQHDGQVTNSPSLGLDSMRDLLTMHEHFAVLADDLASAVKFEAFMNLLSNMVVLTKADPNADGVARTLAGMARVARHSSRIHAGGPVHEVQRTSIVLRSGTDNAAFVRQLEHVVAHTAPDAFEVVVVLDPAAGDDVRAVAGGLEGDVQVIEPDGAGDDGGAWRAGASASTRELVVLLHPGALPSRGWLPPLIDACALDESDAVQVVASVLCSDDRGRSSHVGWDRADDGSLVQRELPSDPDDWGAGELVDVAVPPPTAVAVRGAALDSLRVAAEGSDWLGALCGEVTATGGRVLLNPSSWTTDDGGS